MSKTLTRRQVLQVIGGLTVAGVLNACAPKPTPQPTAAPKAEPTKAPTAAPKAEPTKAPAATTAPAATAAPAAGKCQIDWNPTYPPSPKKYDPPVEVKVIWEQVSMDFPKEGGPWSWDNNPLYNECVKYTGLKPLKHWEAYSTTQQQKLAADLAAGTLPDYFHTGGLFREQLIEAGAIEDIKAIWEATASPLTKEKKMYPNYDWWVPVLRNGKLYGIPFTWGPALNVDNIPFIRQDWLDKLGIKAPETVEGWGEVAAKMKSAGLAQFGISACKNLVTWYHSLDPIFGAFGCMPGCWVPDGAGGLKWDGINPAAKEALAVIAKWYKEGLMDPDFYTYSEGDAAGGIATNKHGIFTAPWWHGVGQVKLERDNPGMKIVKFAYPKGPQGKMGRKGSAFVQESVVFKKGLDPIKIECAINNLNWHMEKHVNWEKYQQYGEERNSADFTEGFWWAFDDKCELKDGPFPGGVTYNYMQQVDFGFAYITYPDYQVQPFNDMKKWTGNLNKAQRYLLSSPIVQREMDYYPYAFETKDIAILDRFWGIPGEKMKKYSADLGTLYSTTYINIVTGNAPLSAFDDFVEQWKKTGGDEITAEVNAWWKSIGGK